MSSLDNSDRSPSPQHDPWSIFTSEFLFYEFCILKTFEKSKLNINRDNIIIYKLLFFSNELMNVFNIQIKQYVINWNLLLHLTYVFFILNQK